MVACPREVVARVMGALLVAGVVVLVTAGPALAQPPVDQPVGAAEIDAILDKIAEEPDHFRVGVDLGSSLYGGLNEGDYAPGGPRALANYELGAEVDLLDRIVATQARMFFRTGTAAVGLTQHALEWVLRFDLGRVLAEPVTRMADRYRTGIIGPLELVHFALLAAVTRAAWLLLRDQGHAGLKELLVALLITAVGAGVAGQADRVACAGLDLLGGTTLAVLTLTSDQPVALDDGKPDLCGGGTGVDMLAPYRAAVFTTFVHEPFLVLQWGRLPEDDEDGCRLVAEALITKGVWDDGDYPRHRMQEAGCHAMAAFNAHMGADRVVASLAYMLATLAFATAVFLTVGLLLVAQVAGAVLITVMPFALVAGIAPGAGREMLFRWFHAVLKVAVLFLGSAVFLSTLLAGIDALNRGLDGEPVAVRLMAIAGLAWMLVILRRHLFATFRFGARSVAARAAGPNADVGGVGRSPGSVVAGGARAVVGTVATLATIKAGFGTAAVAGTAGGKAASTSGSASPSGPVSAGRARRLATSVPVPPLPKPPPRKGGTP